MKMSQYKNVFLGFISIICISTLLTMFGIIIFKVFLSFLDQRFDSLTFFNGSVFGCIGMLVFIAFMLNRKGFFKNKYI